MTFSPLGIQFNNKYGEAQVFSKGQSWRNSDWYWAK